MDRYTKKDVESSFIWLCELLGKTPASKYGEVGSWYLDNNSIYGGWLVCEYVQGSKLPDGTYGTGERHPIINRRLKAREFCEYVNFVSRCLEVIDRDRRTKQDAK